ncbi:MAG: PilZ domain-containing protein [Treponema sp.]|nr:PilZ domain-containing protein [Treponema sp.]
MLAFIIILSIIACLIAAAWFIVHSRISYKKSDKYLEKEKNRLTSARDIKNLFKEYNIPSEYEKPFFEICRDYKIPNILYFIKDPMAISELFQKRYFELKKQKASAQEINDFFSLLYKIEQITIKNKRLNHTKQIPDSSVIFYLTTSGEQNPFTLISKTKEALYLEVPEFLIKRNQQPKLLERNRFVYKTTDGLSYTFVSRAIRYEKDSEGKNIMLIAHSEKLLTEVQRHYKREFLNTNCSFSAIKLNSNAEEDSDDKYIFSNKEYRGILTNISGGGCCIKTSLPIKEKQNLNVNLSNLGIKETIIGLIRRTRKLPDGHFALHIQFIEITLETQNKILAYVYKYEI